MALENETFSSDFILLGIFDDSRIHTFLFSLVLGIFTVAFMGNTAMVLLIYLDTQFHTPKYFLLSQLSLMDLMLICTTVPKKVFNYFSGSNSITFAGCATQIFFDASLLGSEYFLLAVMFYDCYVAICHPLRYPNLMRPKICGLMATSSWVLGSTDGVIDVIATFSFYCGSQLSLAWDLGRVTTRLLPHVPPITWVVGMYYGTGLFMYIWHTSHRSPTQDKMVSVFYSILTSMLNPLIYSLCNKEVAQAFKKVLGKGKSGE